MANDIPLYPKELSWLSFNERVLQEVEDESVPIVERVHFLGIFSNNMDEFFRTQVAGVRRLTSFSIGTEQKAYFTRLLEKINKRILRLEERYSDAYAKVMEELGQYNIHIVREGGLNCQQLAFVKNYFQREVLPELEPFFIDGRSPMPLLNERDIYFAITLKLKGEPKRYAAMEIPTSILPRFIEIPARKGKKEKVYIVLDNIIRICLLDIFRSVLPIISAKAYMFKISRDADIELSEQITQNILDRIERSLKQRMRADPVRLAYDMEMPKILLDLVKKKLKMGNRDSYTPGGRYHNSKDLMHFASDSKSFLYRRLVPLPTLPVNQSVFEQLQASDLLFYYPYHDFLAITNFLASASIDPQVREIRITLYRMAKNSRVIAALINAARNNIKVIAVVELRASFDEEANICWSRKLIEAGVLVIYGVPELEVHAKLISVVRREQGKNRFYTQLGTGNFNESTARVYCDFSVLTNHQAVGRDIYNLFEYMRFPNIQQNYKHIIVSPFSLRQSFDQAIEREIEAARKGREASLFFKCNSLVDSQLIALFYRASAAGVKIRLLVRGQCALMCETLGLSDNIKVVSLIDKYLEHARVYIFHNGGDEVMWISSANLKKRSLDQRIEVTYPVMNTEHYNTIRKIMELQWSDNQKARLIDAGQTNTQLANEGHKGCRAQDAIYRYLRNL
ncbi:polyphosphate kinase 1 [Microbulbifer sp. OS29]|uniref:Polyphosphate kinase n=1 Tax=Microbulbifer okhotskensis TaxID=2926617 RepID=A0A9X2J4N7_9GAMM|nr:polyphosphate kinase 1 [Microbulbifer okhotskensis]MCO1334722.1 polyphosphate kinase 1 [Microbulbifer okhotskensis]